MKPSEAESPSPPFWNSFSDSEGARIDRSLQRGEPTCCPPCGEILERGPEERLSPCLVLDVITLSLRCVRCRKEWTSVRQANCSLALLRMRRLAAAVRAAGVAREVTAERTARKTNRDRQMEGSYSNPGAERDGFAPLPDTRRM
jgi:hypothetical protein